MENIKNLDMIFEALKDGQQASIVMPIFDAVNGEPVFSSWQHLNEAELACVVSNSCSECSDMSRVFIKMDKILTTYSSIHKKAIAEKVDLNISIKNNKYSVLSFATETTAA